MTRPLPAVGSQRTKKLIAGFGVVLLGSIGVITLYIPYYSDFEPAKKRRDEV